jgi:hypothetical protein
VTPVDFLSNLPNSSVDHYGEYQSQLGLEKEIWFTKNKWRMGWVRFSSECLMTNFLLMPCPPITFEIHMDDTLMPNKLDLILQLNRWGANFFSNIYANNFEHPICEIVSESRQCLKICGFVRYCLCFLYGKRKGN